MEFTCRGPFWGLYILWAASNAATNRDRPMGHVGFLKVLIHEATPPRERELGEGVGSR